MKNIRECFLKNSFSKEKIVNTVLLTGDASSRQYGRVFTKNRSYIVCLYEKSERERMPDFLGIQKMFRDSNVCVPKIHEADLKSGYFILEDLEDVTLLKKMAQVQTGSEEIRFYKMAIEQLLKIHSIDNHKKPHPVFQRAFDCDKLMEEVAFSLKHLVLGLMNYALTKEDEKILTSSYESICRKISCEKMVLSHRDFHSRNLMFYNQSLFVIDFQDARMGLPQYDLVSLLDDSYYNVSEENKKILKAYYFDRCSGYADGFEHFLRLYDYTKMQRVFKALGSFGYLYQIKKDERYLKYIGLGFTNLSSTLSNYPEFYDLKALLSRVYYESG